MGGKFAGCAVGTRAAKQAVESDIAGSQVGAFYFSVGKVGTKRVVRRVVSMDMKVFCSISSLQLLSIVV